MIYCLLYMKLMSAYPDYLAYFAIGFIELFLFLGGFCMLIGGAMADSASARNSMLGNGAVLCILFCIMNCVLVCFWKQMMTAIAICDATADFFMATKRLVFVSIGSFALQLLVFLMGIGALLGVASSWTYSRTEPNICPSL